MSHNCAQANILEDLALTLLLSWWRVVPTHLTDARWWFFWLSTDRSRSLAGFLLEPFAVGPAQFRGHLADFPGKQSKTRSSINFVQSGPPKFTKCDFSGLAPIRQVLIFWGPPNEGPKNIRKYSEHIVWENSKLKSMLSWQLRSATVQLSMYGTDWKHENKAHLRRIDYRLHRQHRLFIASFWAGVWDYTKTSVLKHTLQQRSAI